MNHSLHLSIQFGVTQGSLLFTNAQLQFSENQAWMCCGEMSIHKCRHPKATGTSEHAGHCTVHTATDLIRLIAGTWLPKVKGRTNAALQSRIFWTAQICAQHTLGWKHWEFTSRNFVCKWVPGQAILFLFPHSLLTGIKCLVEVVENPIWVPHSDRNISEEDSAWVTLFQSFSGVTLGVSEQPGYKQPPSTPSKPVVH